MKARHSIAIVFTLLVFAVFSRVAYPANCLFKSGFEGSTMLAAPANGWQNITGFDSISGFPWPITAWSGNSSCQILTGAYNLQIQTVTGHARVSTKALYQSMDSVNDWQSQVELNWLPTNSLPQQTDLYTSAWFKLQPDLATQLVSGQLNGFYGNWRSLWGWKTGGQGANYGGDYRIELMIMKNSSGNLYWSIEWDNNANGPDPLQTYWTADNAGVPVPLDQWFRLETFTHRSKGNDGRNWIKVNGQVVFDHSAPNIGIHSYPINRVFLALDYTNGHVPAYQWADDIEIWDGVPDSVTTASIPAAPAQRVNGPKAMEYYLDKKENTAVFDMLGRKQTAGTVLKRGVYFVQVRGKENIQTGKLVVKN